MRHRQRTNRETESKRDSCRQTQTWIDFERQMGEIWKQRKEEIK